MGFRPVLPRFAHGISGFLRLQGSLFNARLRSGRPRGTLPHQGCNGGTISRRILRHEQAEQRYPHFQRSVINRDKLGFLCSLSLGSAGMPRRGAPPARPTRGAPEMKPTKMSVFELFDKTRRYIVTFRQACMTPASPSC